MRCVFGLVALVTGGLWMALVLLAGAPLGLALAVFVAAAVVVFGVLCALALGHRWDAAHGSLEEQDRGGIR